MVDQWEPAQIGDDMEQEQAASVIINNDIDQKNYEYLLTQVDQVAIEYAVNELATQNKRPYLSNIFKVLDIPPRK